jgi:hypothetical protein
MNQSETGSQEIKITTSGHVIVVILVGFFNGKFALSRSFDRKLRTVWGKTI